MTTALVLCGCSAHGSIEVGLYKAIIEIGFHFDLIVGTSIGAINGAMIASGATPEELTQCWKHLRTRDVLDFRWWWLRAIRNTSSLTSGRRLEKFIEMVLPIRTFEELSRKLVVVATDLEDNKIVLLDRGNLIDALMASMALPGILPPRRVDGRLLIDGAVTANMPVLIARNLGADRIITFPCRCLVDWKKTPVSFAQILLKSVAILIKSQEEAHLQLVKQDVETIVLEACPGQRVGTLDFDNSHELIEPAYQQARVELANHVTVKNNYQ